MSNVRRREEKECHVCQIRWCSLDHVWANRKTCSEECRHMLSSLKQRNPSAPQSHYRHQGPFAKPRLKDVAAALGVPFFSARGRLGGAATMAAMTDAKRRALARKGGLATMAKRTPEERRAIGRKAAALANHKRWGTPLPDWLKP